MEKELLIIDPGPDIYYNKGFMDTLESYMEYLRNHTSTVTRLVPVEDRYIYNGDLYGYLNSIKIPLNMHWVIMRLNKFNSPLDFNKDTEYIIYPSSTELDRIKQIYMSVNK